MLQEDDVPGNSVRPPTRWTPRAREPVHLRTAIPPAHANHSFNGLLFDIRAIGIEDVVLTGLVIGGEIGNYNVYFRHGSWRGGYQHEDGWQNVVESFHEPDWTGAFLSLPRLLIRAGRTCAVFVHSKENHDRGIAYQSYGSYDERILDDGTVAVFPGQARIGTDAFVRGDDEMHRWGWHRGPRGLAGALVYESIPLRWNFDQHLKFPPPFRAAVEAVLLCARRPECLIAVLPTEVLVMVMGFLDWRDWKCDRELPFRARSSESILRDDLFEREWGRRILDSDDE